MAQQSYIGTEANALLPSIAVERFPVELWLAVFRNLAHPGKQDVFESYHGYTGSPGELDTDHGNKTERRRALYSLCLVSKAFRQLAEPVLYDTIVSSENHDLQSDLAFLRTIFAIPERGRRFRSLSLPGWHQDARFYEQDVTADRRWEIREAGLAPAMARFLQQQFPQSRSGRINDNISTIEWCLGAGDDGAIMASFILLCPDIRKLQVSVASALEQRKLVSAFRLAAIARDIGYKSQHSRGLGQPQFLQHLEELTLHHHCDPSPSTFSTDDWSDVLGLPSLSTLRLHRFGNWDISPSMPCNLTLRTMPLFECRSRADNLAALMSFCPHLTKLEITWAVQGGPLTELSKSIAEHTPCLTDLILDVPGDCSLGSGLAGLKSLSRMMVSNNTIWSLTANHYRMAEMIPHSVTTLGILIPNHAVREADEAEVMRRKRVGAGLRSFLREDSHQNLTHIIAECDHRVNQNSSPRWRRELNAIKDVYDEQVAQRGWTATEEFGCFPHRVDSQAPMGSEPRMVPPEYMWICLRRQQ